MQREVDSCPYLIQSKAVRDEIFNRQPAAKYKIGGFLLEVHRGAIRSKNDALAHANIGS